MGINPSDTAMVVAMAFDAFKLGRVAHRAARSVHNAARDVLDALDLVSAPTTLDPRSWKGAKR